MRLNHVNIQKIFFLTFNKNNYKMVCLKFPVDVQELEVVLTSKLGNDKVDIVEDLDQISFIDLDAAQTFRDQQKWLHIFVQVKFIILLIIINILLFICLLRKLFLLVTTSDEPSYEDNDNQSDIYETTNIKHRHMKQIISARKRFKPAKISGKCYVARKPGYFLINAYLLVFFITVLSTAIFAINFSLTHFRLLSTYVILLTSVSFKWVVNRSLPPVSYLTSLDAYQISSVVFICCEGIWHSIIGAPHLVPRGTGINVDPWIHIVFTILFVLMQFVFVVWLYYAYDKVRKIKLKEKLYFHDHRDYFSVPNSTHLPNLKLPNFGKNIINFHH